MQQLQARVVALEAKSREPRKDTHNSGFEGELFKRSTPRDTSLSQCRTCRGGRPDLKPACIVGYQKAGAGLLNSLWTRTTEPYHFGPTRMGREPGNGGYP